MFLLIFNAISTATAATYFNTSHVSINLARFPTTSPISPNFNTSHVSINPLLFALRGCICLISIHLMFLLINTGAIKKTIQHDFNTSHVSINPTLLSAFPFLLYLKFLENTSFFKFFPSVSQT